MRPVEVGLAMTPLAQRNQVERVVVALDVVNVVDGQRWRAVRILSSAYLTGVGVALSYLRSQTPIELSRPRPLSVAVAVARITATVPFLSSGFSAFFGPILAHLSPCFALVFTTTHMRLGFARKRLLHLGTVFGRAFVGRAVGECPLAARRAALDFPVDDRATVYTRPHFSLRPLVGRAARFRAEDVADELRGTASYGCSARSTGARFRHLATSLTSATLYHHLGGEA